MPENEACTESSSSYPIGRVEATAAELWHQARASIVVSPAGRFNGVAAFHLRSSKVNSHGKLCKLDVLHQVQTPLENADGCPLKVHGNGRRIVGEAKSNLVHYPFSRLFRGPKGTEGPGR